MKPLVIVVAVKKEAEALREVNGIEVVTTGIGAVNASSSITERIFTGTKPAVIINLGLGGILPFNNLKIGDVVVAEKSVYYEEGIQMPSGWKPLNSIGFNLLSNKEDGNTFYPSNDLFESIKGIKFPSKKLNFGGIATVSTISGTDMHAQSVQSRTNCVAEAMEGAAVIHVANKNNIPAIEIRVMSNTTGNRDDQIWDLQKSLKTMSDVANALVKILM